MENGQIVASTDDPDDYESLNNPTYNQIIIDITTSFTVLVGIFFPSCTGVYFLLYFGYNNIVFEGCILDFYDQCTHKIGLLILPLIELFPL